MIDFYGPQWEDASWILSGKTQFQHNTHSRHYLQNAGYFHSNALWKNMPWMLLVVLGARKRHRGLWGASHPRYIRATQLLEHDPSRLFPLGSAQLFVQRLWPRPEIFGSPFTSLPCWNKYAWKGEDETWGRGWGRKASPWGKQFTGMLTMLCLFL